MKVKLADETIRDAQPGDRIKFRNGSVVEVQKNGQFRNTQKKSVAKSAVRDRLSKRSVKFL